MQWAHMVLKAAGLGFMIWMAKLQYENPFILNYDTFWSVEYELALYHDVGTCWHFRK